MTARFLTGVLAVLLGLFASRTHALPPQDDAPALHPDTFELNPPGRPFSVRARVELGSLGVVSHHIQYGDTTRVDYRSDADQDTLFLFARLSAALGIGDHHSVILLYQPLNLETEAVLGRDLQVRDASFAAGTPVRFGYGFDFYRASYQYDVFSDGRRELAFGGGFQIRNARTSFVSSDGATGFTETGPGVVPLLRMRVRYLFDNALFVEGELEGWASPIPGQGQRNGKLALGSIADVALRGGVRVTRSFETFLTVRYLGGGFRGESSDDTLPTDQAWTSNWLHTLIFSVGVGMR